jgi:hypothetical protein
MRLRTVSNALAVFGLDPVKFAGALVALPRFLADLARFVRSPERPIPLGKLYPCLHDRAEAAGCASGHYFHQDLYVARQIFARRPARHVDVGSRIDGFVAHLLIFMPVEVVDVRPLDRGGSRASPSDGATRPRSSPTARVSSRASRACMPPNISGSAATATRSTRAATRRRSRPSAASPARAG